MSSEDVIVFGPTGDVASAAARQARKLGVKVYLGMRDVRKPISGLSATEEQEDGFERVYADLTKPDSLHAAVTKTGVKRAFLYIIFGAPDAMKASIAALKEAGITFVVLLSSGSVRGDASAVPPDSFIAWQHARVEMALEDVFGKDGYVAIRATQFASNSQHWRDMITAGHLVIPYPDAVLDWISSRDIGNVCGSILAEGPKAVDANAVYLSGPELLSQREAAGIIGSVVGKDVQVSRLDDDKIIQYFQDHFGVPEDGARYLAGQSKKREEGDGLFYDEAAYNDAVANIRKYSGEEPTKFHEWVSENRAKFI